MKHEWRKQEKKFYLSKQKPEILEIPTFKFFLIEGNGNPNDNLFAEYVGVLYSLAYAVKMSPKKGMAPKGYFEYTVYPLEGIWDISEEAKKRTDGNFSKDDLVFQLMIRQPDFVDDDYAKMILQQTKLNKPNPLLEKVKFEKITDGLCVQMMHLGSYDSEPESFNKMLEFAEQENLARISKTHREIYLSDARKVKTEELKTTLRFQVRNK